MDNQNDKNKLASRREFFKKAAKKTLPIFGVLLLTSIPVNLTAKKIQVSDCQEMCQFGCRSGCTGCTGKCLGVCKGCESNCKVTCTGWCKGDCSGGCKGTCDSGCKDDCQSSSWGAGH